MGENSPWSLSAGATAPPDLPGGASGASGLIRPTAGTARGSLRAPKGGKRGGERAAAPARARDAFR
eukprot:12350412-Alexandrium_andersonii.AAC.1